MDVLVTFVRKVAEIRPALLGDMSLLPLTIAIVGITRDFLNRTVVSTVRWWD